MKEQVKLFVDYLPDPAATNAQIKWLNDRQAFDTPEQIATRIASSVAACAFIMLASNSPEVVKRCFGELIDDAQKQHERRLAEMKEKEMLQ